MFDYSVIHDSISHNDASDINFGPLTHIVVSINQHCQVRNVLPCIRLSSDEEFTTFVLRELLEEI